MGTQENQAFLQIAALFGHQMVTELQALYVLEAQAKELDKAGHDEEDELLSLQIEKINERRDVYNKMSKMRTEVEFMAAGYPGTPCCGECQEQRTGPAKDPIGAMLEDLIKHGIGVTRIDPADLFKDREPKTGQTDPAKPPSENKAETAAFEAKTRTTGGASSGSGQVAGAATFGGGSGQILGGTSSNLDNGGSHG